MSQIAATPMLTMRGINKAFPVTKGMLISSANVAQYEGRMK